VVFVNEYVLKLIGGRKVDAFEVRVIEFCRFWSIELFKERLVEEAASYFLSKVTIAYLEI
jgi:hypothetical protein